jgi:geranylgeranyl pyrophosphate synthase
VETTAEIRAQAHRLVTQVLLECHYGQALDLSVRLSDLEQSEVAGVVRTIAELKTGSLMGLAAGLGALVSGAEPNAVRAAVRFGRELGVGLQMLDDLSGLINQDRKSKGLEDVTQARPTWPWAWLSIVLDRESFASLQAQARAVQEGAPAEPLLAELGARMTPQAKRRASSFLEQAFARFASAAPAGMQLGAFRLELERLERSYV